MNMNKNATTNEDPTNNGQHIPVENKQALHIGCGMHKMPGAIGLDIVDLPGVDVVVDLERESIPFPDNSFEIVYAHHVLEHITRLNDVLTELHRVCRPGARIEIVVPYFTCVGAFGDPTHVRFFTYGTFEHFTETKNKELYTWFSSTRFAIKYRRIGFGRLFRLLGVQWWANRWPNIYENFFAYMLPARTLTVELIVTKDTPPGRHP
jgi:SAM-dependent methyltransferase